MSGSVFFSGVYMITFAAAGLFFLKFHRASGDRFFRFFSYACWFLALERVVLLFLTDPFVSVSTPQSKSESWVYLLRLAAFIIIVLAIFDRNRRGSSAD